MGPADFIRKWERSTLTERAGAQSHFIDLCDLLDEPRPTDPETYCFEKGATKETGGNGFADVWKRRHFGWEYKAPGRDLDAAHRQLLNYSVALENPPLLIVSDTKKIVIRTNWTNTVQERHEIGLTDLLDAGKRAILKAAFSDPEKLKPKRTRTQLTAEAADEFSALAQRLRARGRDPHQVAHFVNRLVFCMFAEDVNLLPGSIFTRMLEHCRDQPAEFEQSAKTLFAAMKESGGRVGFEKIEWFNGGLFDDDEALPLDGEDIRLALKAAKLDWQEIDPSILGTLFERGLDPDKRSQLGAHYTDRDKIMMIVGPVIVEPLTAAWTETKAKIEVALEKERKAKSKAAATKAHKDAVKLHGDFIERLTRFRVLDPACGSGNFLYLSLQALKDIEHRANLDAEAMGLPRAFPRVGPEAVKGIEINPYAAELARVSIWIGEIQWMLRNGFDAARNPILRPLGSIECRDALIEQDEDGQWREADWPDADVIVGNPPFLGTKKMKGVLGSEPLHHLKKVFDGRVSGFSDYVCYWFKKAELQIVAGQTKRAGLVATNSISGGRNRLVLDDIDRTCRIFFAYSDEPWVVDGASVRVALIGFERESEKTEITLNGSPVEYISPQLTSNDFGDGLHIGQSVSLLANSSIAFNGVVKGGEFEVPGDIARQWMGYTGNPNGKKNSLIVRPWMNGFDVVRRPRDFWLIDFGQRDEAESSMFELPFRWVIDKVKPYRTAGVPKKGRNSPPPKKEATYWWRLSRPGSSMKAALANLPRYVAIPEVAKHRAFVWLSGHILPDKNLVVFARDDDTTFGVLHSTFHEVWSLRMGTSLEDRPRYTPTTCFETFPFPEGLTPDIPAADYADDPRAQRIAEAAARLNELRENWLNPPDLVRREPEVVAGYPDRILPVDEKAAAILKKRTLTNLYNERPAWLDHAHRALDEAVAAAYGWEADFKAGKLVEEEILKRLFDLNQARAAAAR